MTWAMRLDNGQLHECGGSINDADWLSALASAVRKSTRDVDVELQVLRAGRVVATVGVRSGGAIDGAVLLYVWRGIEERWWEAPPVDRLG